MWDQSSSTFKSALLILLAMIAIPHVLNFATGASSVGRTRNTNGSQSIDDDSDEIDAEETNCMLRTEHQRINNSETTNLEDLLSIGSDKIQSFPDVDEAVLILGNTGCGKTTLTHILTGDLSRIFGVRTQSGTLVIVDDDEKIGTPSTHSKTIFPDFILVPDNPPHGIYDCPGFSDNRGIDQDIATNFFMNQIVKKVTRIKMLFLVNHASIKMGYDRLDFDLLAQHVSKFVKNLSNYKTSIGLVVMKVSSYSDSGKFVKDKSIMKEIIEFLSTFNQTLHSKLASEQDQSERVLISGKMEFVDALLQKDDKSQYSKITFSRSVETCGPLSESVAVAQSKERVTFLHKNLPASPVDPTDFGFSLKDKTSLRISKFMESNNLAISKSFEILVKYFQMWFDKGNIDLQVDLLSSSESLQRNYLFIENLTNQTTAAAIRTNNSVDPLELGEMLVSMLRNSGFPVPLHFQLFLRRQQAYFDFFDEAVGSRLVRTSANWQVPIHRLQSDISNLRDWYEFCSNLEISLYSYTFQVGKAEYASRGETSLLDFIEANKLFVVSKRIHSIAASIDSVHLQVLSSILDFALTTPEWSCRGKTLTISGNFVLFTDFINGANKTLTMTCSKETKKVEVYAAHSVFIDDDLEVIGKELNVVVIAPIWQVIGSRKLNLSGENGAAIEPRKAVDGESVAPDSKQCGGNGVDGIPGKPGGAGGSFYGIARKIERGDSLEIVVNGGNGGPGQHGGKGGQGAKGGTSEKSSNDTEYPFVARGLYPVTHPKPSFKMFPGFPGYSGGNGGGGGVGGIGGLPGQVNIVSLESPSSLKISMNSGNVGEPGDGGDLGLGGDTGDARVAHLCFYDLESICLFDENVKLKTQKRNNGSKGAANNISVGIKRPRPSHFTIKEWRNVLTFTYTFFTIKQKERLNLSQLMDGSPHIQKHFNAKAFTEEMILLENILVGNGVTVDDLVSAYKSCIKRMESYVESNSGKMTVDEKKVFALLFTSGFSKIASFDQSHDLGMIIDVPSFFKYLEEQLADASTASASLTSADATSVYNSNLSDKAEQVREFISKVVQPALNKAENEIAPRLVSLGKQFEGLLANAEFDLERSKVRLKREREVIVLKQILGVIEVASQVLGFLDPTGTVRMVGIGASLTQNLLMYSNNVDNVRGSNMTSTIGQVRDMYNEAVKMKQLLTPSAESGNGSRSKEALISLGTGVADLYDKYQKDKAKLTNLEALVKESEYIVADVKIRKAAIETSFIPVVDSIMSYFSNLQTHLESKTRSPLAASELDITKWQVGKALQEIKENLQVLASGINTKEFIKSVDTLLDAFTMMINLYNKIEEHQDAKMLCDYLAVLTSASLKNNIQIRNPELSLAISKLEKITRENMLRRDYSRGIHALKQWVFPFAKLHLTQFENDADVGNSDLSQVYLSQIDKLQLQLDKYKATTLSSKDTHVIETNFNSSYVSSRPFFVWENEKFSDEIGELLSGTRVYFYADVRLSVEGWDAIKSSKIEINFKFSHGKSTPDLEKELGDELKHFSVSLTQSGISSYRFQKHIYVMTGANQTISYNFERNLNGDRLGRNQIYTKFAKGDYLLSPYTLWTIQLGNALPKANADFDRLAKFAKLVDLELVGAGVYVDARAMLNANLELDRYYECVDSLWEFEFN